MQPAWKKITSAINNLSPAHIYDFVSPTAKMNVNISFSSSFYRHSQILEKINERLKETQLANTDTQIVKTTRDHSLSVWTVLGQEYLYKQVLPNLPLM